jgi:hypothetical protein
MDVRTFSSSEKDKREKGWKDGKAVEKYPFQVQ